MKKILKTLLGLTAFAGIISMPVFLTQDPVINMMMNDRHGLEAGDEVYCMNLRVGRVESLDLMKLGESSRTYVVVRLRIDRDKLRMLHNQMLFRVERERLLSDRRRVVIHPVDQPGGRLRHGDFVVGGTPGEDLRDLIADAAEFVLPLLDTFRGHIEEGLRRFKQWLPTVEPDSTLEITRGRSTDTVPG